MNSVIISVYGVMLAKTGERLVPSTVDTGSDIT